MKKQLSTLFFTLFSSFWLILVFSPHVMAQTCNEDITPTTPDSRFSINGDGTVTDVETGLTWMRCILGLTWDVASNSCAGSAAIYNSWPGVLSAANVHDFAGYSDWRVPNVKALASIVELACYSPAINETYFPNTLSYDYWSSSPSADNDHAWYVRFDYGYYGYNRKDISRYVRLVRGGQ